MRYELFSLVFTLMLAALLSSCGGGGGGDVLPIYGIPGGGGSSGLDALDPSIDVPPAENFVDYSVPTDSVYVKWAKNLYATLPAPEGPARVFQNASLMRVAEQIFAGVNAERAKHGLSTLKWEPHLEMIAQAHARDMGLRNFFSHITPEGLDTQARLTAVDAPMAHGYGENAAKGQESATEVVSQWMDSTKHRANILDADAVYMGIGAFIDPTDLQTPTSFILLNATFYIDPATHDWLEPAEVE